MSETILKAVDLSKCFKIYTQQRTLFRLSQSLISKNPIKKELWALKNISFEISRGEKLAILGANGAGKTTLLRLLAEILEPTSGHIECCELPHPLFKYGMGMNPILPVIDNVYLLGAFHGLSVEEINKKIDEIISFAELEPFLYVSLRSLSSGQKQRLLFSVFIQSHRSFLAFDESTSAADLRFKTAIGVYFDKLMNSSKTLIMTSHNLQFLSQHCTRAIWLEKGEIKEIGNPKALIKDYKKYALKW